MPEAIIRGIVKDTSTYINKLVRGANFEDFEIRF